ncbi:MAG: hypothetical protein H6551_10670 [Chitinophagales bacterium]|nr:hypothetical protein [Chitinophagaceae bacterium]MCB9065592.1 hypothetical protein [Chitinophagales bacterium]
MKHILLFFSALFLHIGSNAQSFDYKVNITPVSISNLPGLHSYAFAQSNGKWLVIGGRKDGIHARQPFNTFPQAQSNTDIYVIDIATKQFWTASVTPLGSALAEQLQSTNMNFHQDNDTLYIIGGYGYSTTATDHITFNNLISVDIPGLIQAVMTSSSITPYFKKVADPAFAVTGGHLAKIADTFYLVGGHKFDGRYNPMGNPTYTQTYTNQIRKFGIDNSGSQLSFTAYTPITDPVHLRRRDYNLVPQIFPDGAEGYTISSGVFQQNVDLPFLYPVDITTKGHVPQTSFNQYLSNYHSATTSFYDSNSKSMHMLFFGGISQYYYQNGNRIKDDDVPFVNTISRVTRTSNGNLAEYRFADSMPSFKGASAEFILNEGVAHYESGIIKQHLFNKDTILIGHILGGISSSSANPFANNQTSNTSADNTIYEVRLIKSTSGNVELLNGTNPYDVEVYPVPAKRDLYVTPLNENYRTAYYFITDINGRMLQKGELTDNRLARKGYHIELDNIASTSTLFLTVAFDDVFFTTKKISLID